MKSDIGSFYSHLLSYSQENQKTYGFISGEWADYTQWRAQAKAKVHECLGYYPKPLPLDVNTYGQTPCNGYIREDISFVGGTGKRLSGCVLMPERRPRNKRFPAVIALHDHGAFYYFGMEKVMDAEPDEPLCLTEFRRVAYSGRGYASELARRGYLVLVIDGYFFGSQRLKPEMLSPEVLKSLGDPFIGLKEGSDAYIRAFNQACREFEALLVKHIFFAGTTWPGILLYDDRRSMDYLLSRDDVDAAHIGCVGLSIGGFRAAFLAGLDERVHASVVAGWLPNAESLLFNRLINHTYMVYVPLLTRYMDIPDVVSLAAPNALMVQQCANDHLFDLEGMKKANEHIADVYRKVGYPDRFRGLFYDNDHEFNMRMQEDAFAWLDAHLKE